MYVPYSMDEREPDLYGGMGGIRSDDYYESPREYNNVTLEHVECVKFFTQDDMNKVIQHNLQALKTARNESRIYERLSCADDAEAMGHIGLAEYLRNLK